MPAPEYKTEGFFVMTLYKARPADIVVTTTIHGETTEKKTRKIISDITRENPAITTEELAETIGMTRKGIEWHISNMKSEGILKREGPDSGGRWVLLDDNQWN